jgi:hypothetical protein
MIHEAVYPTRPLYGRTLGAHFSLVIALVSCSIVVCVEQL